MRTRSSELTAANWRKSTTSNTGGDAQCVELAYVDRGGAVRDSKENGNGLAVLVPASAFRDFLTAASAGRLAP